MILLFSLLFYFVKEENENVVQLDNSNNLIAFSKDHRLVKESITSQTQFGVKDKVFHMNVENNLNEKLEQQL